MSCLVFARQPDKANEIVVSVPLIKRSKEADLGDDGFDIDQVGVGWLAVFDFEVLMCRFKELGKFLRIHGVGTGLSVFS